MDDQQRMLVVRGMASGRQRAVSPRDAVLDFWRKAFTYSGRAARSDYNWALVTFFVVSAPASALFAYVVPRPASTILAAALWIVFIVPWLALIARRCHDMNMPGVFGLLLVATGIGFLITEALLIFADSDPRGIRFDPPKA